MKVVFENDFFGPDHVLYRKEEEHEVPQDWKNILPKSVTIIVEAKKSKTKQADPEPSPKEVVKEQSDEVAKVLEGKTK